MFIVASSPDVAVEEVYRDAEPAYLLTAAGLQVEDAFLTRIQIGRKVAKEESVRLTSNRCLGPDRDAGVKQSKKNLASIQALLDGIFL